MKIKDIKKEAFKNTLISKKALDDKVLELKNKKVSFLACVAFVQHNQKITLKEAINLTLTLEAYNEKERIMDMIQVMLNEYKT